MKFTFGQNAEVVDKIEGIPGLKIFPDNGFAIGSMDAIAAAQRAAGKRVILRGLPDLTEIPELQASLPKGLRDYQKQGVLWLHTVLKEHGGAMLADDMGLGKTLQTLTTVRLMAGEGRTLVLCPAAALETWRDELQKWGFESAAIFSASNSKAARLDRERAPEAKVVVCSYDYRVLDRCMEAAFMSEYPTFLVLDEAHRLRGRDSKRSKMLASLAPLATWKIAITATPQFNRPRDLYQLLRILYDRRFGSQWDFDKRYCGAVPGKWGGLEYPRKGSFHAEELKLRLSYYMLRREKSEVAHELPPMTFQVRWVDPTSEAKKVFAQAQLNIGKAKLHDAVVATLKGKVEEALALAQDSRRFLLCTWLRSHARELHRILNGDRDTPCTLISGDMPTEKRAEAIRQAKDRGHGIVATTDSVSESLNLQGVASVGILHALDWVPLKLAQLFGRLHRLGQTDPVIWYLVAMRETVDQVIIDTQVNKLDQYRNIFGMKSHRGMRHALADEVAIEKAEKEALKSIYAAMK